MTLPAGYRLGPYEVKAPLGAGGMGEVYRACDTRLGRDVALKVLPRAVSDDPERLRRFEREARAAAALSHPNILAVYDVGSYEGSPYIVSELLEGETLRGRLRRGGLTVRKALEVAVPLARALAAAHEKGIVHRDLKPENVFVTRDNQVKVLDFGLAKLRQAPVDEVASESPTATQQTAPGTVLGTAAYMSPEQVRGNATDARSDIFSFGVMLYEMLTRRRPFRGDTNADVMAAILDRDPADLEDLDSPLSPTLDQIVRRCLEKRPEDRFHSAHDLAIALEAVSGASSEERALFTASARVLGPIVRRPGLAVAAVTLLILLAAAWIGLWARRSPGPGLEPIKSLAVLPIENLSGDPEQEYFVDGMTEELIAQLTQISALKVVSRTSVMRYKGARKPLPDVARELSVDAVVEGSVRRAGGHVRITAQLILASTDRHLWAQSFDRELRDVLNLQSEVARAIAKEIRVTLTPSEQMRLGRSRSVDPEAYQLWLKGNFQMLRLSEEAFRRALEYYQQAIERDPGYAPAHAGAASAYMELGGWWGSLPASAVRSKARDAATRAVELDPTLAEAHLALGNFKYLFEWDWSGADRAFRSGLELTPSSSYAAVCYVDFLNNMGRSKEAIDLGKRTLEMDPLSPVVYNELANALWFAGRDDEAMAQIGKGLELDPDFAQSHIELAYFHVFRGNLKEALAETDERERLTPGVKDEIAVVGLVYGMAGRRDQARRILDQLESRGKKEYVSSAILAWVNLGLGENERALDLLEKAFEERDLRLVLLKGDRVYNPLRSNPRFQRLLRRMSFPD